MGEGSLPLFAWLIVLVPMVFVVGMALYSARHIRSAADYLAAWRMAERYGISVGGKTEAEAQRPQFIKARSGARLRRCGCPVP